MKNPEIVIPILTGPNHPEAEKILQQCLIILARVTPTNQDEANKLSSNAVDSLGRLLSDAFALGVKDTLNHEQLQKIADKIVTATIVSLPVPPGLFLNELRKRTHEWPGGHMKLLEPYVQGCCTGVFKVLGMPDLINEETCTESAQFLKFVLSKRDPCDTHYKLGTVGKIGARELSGEFYNLIHRVGKQTCRLTNKVFRKEFLRSFNEGNLSEFGKQVFEIYTKACFSRRSLQHQVQSLIADPRLERFYRPPAEMKSIVVK